MATNRIRTQDDVDRITRALIPVDQAFWNSEQRYGVGRVERLVCPTTLAAYARGWEAWRLALDEGDADAVEQIGPKMIAALAYMTAEVEAAGHKPLEPFIWETPLGDDGTVLVITRSQAEQAAVIRATKATMFTAAPGQGLRAETVPPSDNLPPDIMLAVRHAHEGRALEVWTVAECAALILAHGSAARAAKKWEGTPARTGRQRDEGSAADYARRGFPLDKPLPTSPTGQPVKLEF